MRNQSQLSIEEKQIEDLRETIQNKENYCQTLEQALSDMQKTQQNQQGNLKDLTEKNLRQKGYYESEQLTLKKVLSKLNFELSKTRNEKKIQEQLINQLNESLNDQAIQCQIMEKNQTQLEFQRNSLNELLETLSNKQTYCEKLEETQIQFKIDLAEQNETLSVLTSQVTELLKEKAELNTILSLTQQEKLQNKEQFEAQKRQYENQLAKYHLQIETLEERATSNQRLLEKQKQNIEQENLYSSQLREQYFSDLSQLKADIIQKEQQIEISSEELQKSLAKNEQFQFEHNDLSQKLQILQTQNQDLKQNFHIEQESFEQKKIQFINQINELQQRNQIFISEFEDIQKQQQSQREKFEEKVLEHPFYKQLKQSNSDLKKHCKLLEAQLGQKQQSNNQRTYIRNPQRNIPDVPQQNFGRRQLNIQGMLSQQSQILRPNFQVDVDNMNYEQILELQEKIGNVEIGLSNNQLSKVIKKQFSKSLSEISQKCTICMEEFNAKEEISQLNCKDIFHPQCIRKWFTANKKCPNCRKEQV